MKFKLKNIVIDTIG